MHGNGGVGNQGVIVSVCRVGGTIEVGNLLGLIENCCKSGTSEKDGILSCRSVAIMVVF